jgi:NADH-quinone oxidoreductase subunit M
VEAPTAGSVILAGVLLKMGTYGILRFSLPLFPVTASVALPWMGVLAVIGILYGGMVAWVQKDIKSLVAYSSVAHLGYVVLGIFSFRAEGIAGSVLQMVNHGISTGALFLLVGFIYERRHTRAIDEFGGLAKVMPLFAAFLMVVAFSSAALPGLNGFVGEFLILLGMFRTNTLLAVLAVPGVVVAALYLLRMLKGVLFGPVVHEVNRDLPDLRPREIASMVPLLALIVWIGVYPATFLEPIRPYAARLEARMSAVRTLPGEVVGDRTASPLPTGVGPVPTGIPDEHEAPGSAVPSETGTIGTDGTTPPELQP